MVRPTMALVKSLVCLHTQHEHTHKKYSIVLLFVDYVILFLAFSNIKFITVCKNPSLPSYGHVYVVDVQVQYDTYYIIRHLNTTGLLSAGMVGWLVIWLVSCRL